MGLRGLDFHPVFVPFAAGLKTKNDPRALDPPGLTICRDVEFDDLGAVRTRKPYAPIGVNILGGGVLANVRRVVANGSELVCFTKDSLYSWDARDAAWALRGTHLAVKVGEQPAFATTDDQVDVDRAELGNTVFYAWIGGGLLYVAALDKTTGAVIAAPTQFGGAATVARPRLVALTTKVLLTYLDASGNLVGAALSPVAATSSAIAATATATLWPAAKTNLYYDVVRIASTDTAAIAGRHNPATSYFVGTVTAALVATVVAIVQPSSGPVAVSASPDGLKLQIVRADGTNVTGDLLDMTLTPIATGQALGTAPGAVNQIAAAHRTKTDGGFYRCYAFWSSAENPAGTAFKSQVAWADTNAAIGGAGDFVHQLGVGSRAFDYDGRIYLWLAFGETSGFTGSGTQSIVGQLQNAYFLYRDDAFLCGEAVSNRGGGLAPSTGRLPGVALTGGSTTYSVCLNERRRIPLGPGTASGVTGTSAGYAMREPVDVSSTFDSNDARRCARLGRTLYIAAGEILQYDGTAITEVGFHTAPCYFSAFTAATGNVEDGTYAYKQSYRSQNAQGELERSTSGVIGTVTTTGGPQKFALTLSFALTVTHKTARPPAVETWRTPKNPIAGTPFYLVNALDPSSTANPNRYIANDPTATTLPTLNDELADAVATTNQPSPENGTASFPNLAPPAATIIAASADRIFLGGVAGDPHRVWYSKQRLEGQVAAFNDGLAFAVPPPGGDMTGIGLLDGTPVVFRQRAVYAIAGDGYDNAGGGSNYGPARLVSSDVGLTNADAFALAPFGYFFKSSKGWYTLDHAFNVKYVGKDVAKFDGDTVLAVHVVESQHQIRCLTNARCLVFDYEVGEWSEWTIADGLHATLWNGTYVYAATGGPKQEQADFSGGTTYGIDVELAFFKPGGPQGQALVRSFQLLGEVRSSHSVRVRVARDYLSDGAGGWTYFDDFPWPITPVVVGGPLQVRHGPSQKRGEAFKVRITAVAADGSSAPTTESCKLTGITFDVGVEPGLYGQLPLGQKK